MKDILPSVTYAKTSKQSIL